MGTLNLILILTTSLAAGVARAEPNEQATRDVVAFIAGLAP